MVQVFQFKLQNKPFLEPLDLVIIMKPCRINGKIFEWILISRRSCFRAGVRYYVRGKKNKQTNPTLFRFTAFLFYGFFNTLAYMCLIQ